MRQVQDPQLKLGSVGIEEIRLNPKSRDDIPAILLGLQHLYADADLRARLFALLEKELCPGVNLDVGRPGLELWKIVVMGVVMQGLGCDFDRLHELVNEHRTLRKFLGHATDWDETAYEYQTVVDNVCLLRPELLAAIGQLVVASGHRVAKKKRGEPLRGRCDSFVVETDVHDPTDVSLLWDAMRCLLRTTGRAAGQHGVRGWRQWRHLSREVQTRFHRVRTTRRAQAHPERITASLQHCRALAARAETTLGELVAVAPLTGLQIEGYLAHARRQIDQVERRLLRGETIPHDEKVFSIFENHTRWISKGKAGRPVELGVPVCVLEDQHGFLLYHEILWEGGDTDIAVPMIEAAQARYPDLRACSFDRGFHSPANRLRLDALLEHNVLPRKGRWNRADRVREEDPAFVAARRQHPAVESAIHNLEHRGLDRVRAYGPDGFARVVALSMLAFNIHRLGLLLRRRAQSRARRRTAA